MVKSFGTRETRSENNIYQGVSRQVNMGQPTGSGSVWKRFLSFGMTIDHSGHFERGAKSFSLLTRIGLFMPIVPLLGYMGVTPMGASRRPIDVS